MSKKRSIKKFAGQKKKTVSIEHRELPGLEVVEIHARDAVIEDLKRERDNFQNMLEIEAQARRDAQFHNQALVQDIEHEQTLSHERFLKIEELTRENRDLNDEIVRLHEMLDDCSGAVHKKQRMAKLPAAPKKKRNGWDDE